MRIILLSGGSGKRLWPLSNEVRSKCFLKLLPAEDGTRESMIQRVCRQLDHAGFLSDTLIVTNKSQVEITRYHIGDQVCLLAEPEKRGTFMAIALAASYVHDKQAAKMDETLCVIPVDLFVESDFYQLLHQMPSILSQSGSELALVGTVPDRPSSQYGYIVPGMSEGKAYAEVSMFVEKPEEPLAANLLQRDALWNCGIFAFRLSFMLTCLRNRGLPVHYEQLIDRYSSYRVTSFDEEVVEQTRSCVVVPYSGTWKDLGDWNVFADYLGSPVIGKGQVSTDSERTHLVNELACPIHVIGCSNTIVAASPDGILVANRSRANEIKSQLADGNIPMVMEKRWGKVTILDHANGQVESMTKKIDLLPGRNTSYHAHPTHKEIMTMISGTGQLILDGHLQSIQAGDVLEIPQGIRHSVKALSPLQYIVTQLGSESNGEDVIRTNVIWEEIINNHHSGPS